MQIFETYENVSEMKNCMKRALVIQSKQMDTEFRVMTMEGDYKLGKPGDYLMRGVDGELYICDKNVFEKTYDWV